MPDPTEITHKTAFEWNALLAEEVFMIHPDGFDDVEADKYLMSREEFEDRLFQSVFQAREDGKIWQDQL